MQTKLTAEQIENVKTAHRLLNDSEKTFRFYDHPKGKTLREALRDISDVARNGTSDGKPWVGIEIVTPTVKDAGKKVAVSNKPITERDIKSVMDGDVFAMILIGIKRDGHFVTENTLTGSTWTYSHAALLPGQVDKE